MIPLSDTQLRCLEEAKQGTIEGRKYSSSAISRLVNDKLIVRVAKRPRSRYDITKEGEHVLAEHEARRKSSSIQPTQTNDRVARSRMIPAGFEIAHTVIEKRV